MSLNLTQPYKSWLAELKINIGRVRLQTALQVNANMLWVYWYIGKEIIDKQKRHGWSAGVIKQLAIDLRKSFPDTKGFSERNLVYMRQFAAEYGDTLFTQTVSAQITQALLAQTSGKQKKAITQALLAQIQQVAQSEFGHAVLAQISWAHHVVLMDKVSDIEERLWYINQIVLNKWSSRVLHYQISTDLYHRQAKSKKNNNFHLILPKEQSDSIKYVHKYLLGITQLKFK